MRAGGRTAARFRGEEAIAARRGVYRSGWRASVPTPTAAGSSPPNRGVDPSTWFVRSPGPWFDRCSVAAFVAVATSSDQPPRTSSGYRCYQQGDLERVIFIRRNQLLGFTLIEIKQLMDLHSVLASMNQTPFRRRPGELQGIIEIGRERLLAIREKSRALNAMRRQLERLIEHLESATVVTCPVQSSAKCPAAKPKKFS